MFSNKDRTLEVEESLEGIPVMSNDYCQYHKKHPDTFLLRKECWTCLYSDFGIDSGYPMDTGRCNLSQGEIKRRF